jgi:flagellar biosynthesis/type III secretory pathway M-ring protein FliF/YscJ
MSPEVVPVGLSQEATISIAVVVSGIVAGLAIFFIVFFVRKNKAKKANSKKKRLEDEDKTKYEAIQLNNPVITLTNTTSSSVSSGTFDTESIDKRLRIPYKRLKFIKEIGSGSYGKVFCG